MNSPRFPRFSVPDAARSRLRATVATIEREIARLPREDVDGLRPPNGLAAACADLVEQLAFGPEPEVRECPVCKNIGMRTATFCGYCWSELTPPTDDEDMMSGTRGTQGYDIGGEG